MLHWWVWKKHTRRVWWWVRWWWWFTFFTIIYYVCNSNPSCKHVIIIFILLYTPSSSCRRLTASVHSSALEWENALAGAPRYICIYLGPSHGSAIISFIISSLSSALYKFSHATLRAHGMCLLGSTCHYYFIGRPTLLSNANCAPPEHQNYMLNKQTSAKIILLLQEERLYFVLCGWYIAGQVDGNLSRGDDTNLLRLMRNLCMLRWLRLREETLIKVTRSVIIRNLWDERARWKKVVFGLKMICGERGLHRSVKFAEMRLLTQNFTGWGITLPIATPSYALLSSFIRKPSRHTHFRNEWD